MAVDPMRTILKLNQSNVWLEQRNFTERDVWSPSSLSFRYCWMSCRDFSIVTNVCSKIEACPIINDTTPFLPEEFIKKVPATKTRELIRKKRGTTGLAQQSNNNYGTMPCMCCIIFWGLTQTHSYRLGPILTSSPTTKELHA